MAVGLEDGLYRGSSKAQYNWEVEDDTQGAPHQYYQPPEATVSLTVNPFLQITRTSWTPDIVLPSAGSDFSVSLVSSTNCVGPANILGSLTGIPNGMQYTWGGLQSPNVYTNLSIQGANTTNAVIRLQLNGGVTGTVQGTGTLHDLPNCEPRDPPTGSSRVSSLTVKSQ